MALTPDQVKRIKAMKHNDLVAHAQSEDFAVVVEASLRLHRTTKVLNVVLILLTGALVYFAYTQVKSSCLGETTTPSVYKARISN